MLQKNYDIITIEDLILEIENKDDLSIDDNFALKKLYELGNQFGMKARSGKSILQHFAYLNFK